MSPSTRSTRPPYSRGFFASRLQELLGEVRSARGLDPVRFAERIGQSPETVDDWCERRSLPERTEDLQSLATEIAGCLDSEMTSVVAELRHAMCLDILDHTIRDELRVSLDTTADLLDELRLRT